MGHLVNPISMRLGWFSDWLDSWYSDNLYYTEYFYAILKIRLFLIFYWGDKTAEKVGFFYSHFSVLKFENTLYVNMFIYDGLLEGYIEAFSFNHFRYVRNFNLRRDIYRPYASYHSWKFLIVMNWLPAFVCVDDQERI